MESKRSGYFRSISILHLAIVVGQAMFLLIALFLYSQKNAPFIQDSTYSEVLVYAISGVVPVAYLIANMFYNKKLSAINTQNSLEGNKQIFRKSLIICLAILEGATLINVIFFLVFGNFVNAIVALIGILIAYFYKPNKERLVNLFGVQADQIQE